MRLTCPGCAATGSIELFTADVDARHCAQLAGKLPPAVGAVVFQYLSLFRAGERGLQWKRARKLLEELEPAITAGTLRRHGRDWSAPPDAWRHAFETMLAQRDKLTLPLKSHGYLYEVLTGVADRAEAIEEKRSEESRAVVSSQQGQGNDGASPISSVLESTWIRSENAFRQRAGQPLMTPDEEREHVARLRR